MGNSRRKEELMEREKKTDKNRQIDRNKTKQVRISYELHRLLKLTAAKVEMTMKSFLDELLPELLEKIVIDEEKKEGSKRK